MTDPIVEAVARAISAAFDAACVASWPTKEEPIALAAIAAHVAALDAAGWQVVPKEMTDEMEYATKRPNLEVTWGNRCRWIWRKALAAAPKPEGGR